MVLDNSLFGRLDEPMSFTCIRCSLLNTVLSYWKYVVPVFRLWHSVFSFVRISSLCILPYRIHIQKQENAVRGGEFCKILIAILFLLPVLVISFNNHTNLDSNRISLIGYIIALLGIVQTILVSKLISKTKIMSTTLSYLGRNSLVIMLTHFIYLQLYCHFVHEFSPYVIYKVLQALVVFGLSMASVHVFQGRLAILIGKNSK